MALMHFNWPYCRIDASSVFASKLFMTVLAAMMMVARCLLMRHSHHYKVKIEMLVVPSAILENCVCAGTPLRLCNGC